MAAWLSWSLRIVVAVLILGLVARFGFRSMRGYVHGGWAEQEERESGPTPTMEIVGDVRMRCPTCGFEVKVLRVPENDAGPYELKALRHCRDEMVAIVDSELST
jgi:hypothetical protein